MTRNLLLWLANYTIPSVPDAARLPAIWKVIPQPRGSQTLSTPKVAVRLTQVVLPGRNHQRRIASNMRPMLMRRTAWIWLIGCIAWTADGIVNVVVHSPQHAELAFLVALLFGIAWLFYRNQRR